MVLLHVVAIALSGISYFLFGTEQGRDRVQTFKTISAEALCASILFSSWPMCQTADGPIVLEHPNRFGSTIFAAPCVDNVLVGHLAETRVVLIDNISIFYTKPDVSYFCTGNETNSQHYQSRPATDYVSLVSTQQEDQSYGDSLTSVLAESKPDLSFLENVLNWFALYGTIAFLTSIICVLVGFIIYLFRDRNHWKYNCAAFKDKFDALKASVAKGEAGEVPGLLAIINDWQMRFSQLESRLAAKIAEATFLEDRALCLSQKFSRQVLRCWSNIIKCSILTRRVSALENDLQQVQSAKSSLSQKVTNLNQQLQQKALDNKSLTKQLSTAQENLKLAKSTNDTHTQQAFEDKMQIQSLTTKNEDLTRQASEDKEEIEKQKLEVQRLTLQASQDKQQIEKQNSDNQCLTQQASAQGSEIKAQKTRIESVERDASTVGNELQAEKRKTETLINENATLDRKLQGKIVHNNTLSSQVSGLQQESRSQKSRIESLDREVSTKVDELQNLKSDTAAVVQEAVEKVTIEKEKLGQELSATKTELLEQKSTVTLVSEELSTKKKELDDKNVEAQNLGQRLAGKETELKKQKSQESSLNGEVSTLKQKLQNERSTNNKNLKQKGVDHQADLDRLQTGWEARVSQDSAAQDRKIEEKSSELADANNRIAEVSSELNNVKNQLSSVTNEMDNVKHELRDVTDELANTKSRNTQDLSSPEKVAATNSSVTIAEDDADDESDEDDNMDDDDDTQEDSTQTDPSGITSGDVSGIDQAEDDSVEPQKKKRSRKRGQGGPKTKTLPFQLFPYPHYEVVAQKERQLTLPFPTEQSGDDDNQTSSEAQGGPEDRAEPALEDNTPTPEDDRVDDTSSKPSTSTLSPSSPQDENDDIATKYAVEDVDQNSVAVNSAATSTSSTTAGAGSESDSGSSTSTSQSISRTSSSSETSSKKSPDTTSKQDTHQAPAFSVRDSAALGSIDRSETPIVPPVPLPPIARQEGGATVYIYPDNPAYGPLASQGQPSSLQAMPWPLDSAHQQHGPLQSFQSPSDAVGFIQQIPPSASHATTQQTESWKHIFRPPSDSYQFTAGSPSLLRNNLAGFPLTAAAGPSQFSRPARPLAKGESPRGNLRNESTRLTNEHRRKTGKEQNRLARKAATGNFKGVYNPAYNQSQGIGTYTSVGPSQMQALSITPALPNSTPILPTGPPFGFQTQSVQPQNASPYSFAPAAPNNTPSLSTGPRLDLQAQSMQSQNASATPVTPAVPDNAPFVPTGPRLDWRPHSMQYQKASSTSQEVKQKDEGLEPAAGLTESKYAQRSVQQGKQAEKVPKSEASLTESKFASPSTQQLKSVMKEESKQVAGLNGSMYAPSTAHKANQEKVKEEKTEETVKVVKAEEDKTKEEKLKEEELKKRAEKGRNAMMGSRWSS